MHFFMILLRFFLISCLGDQTLIIFYNNLQQLTLIYIHLMFSVSDITPRLLINREKCGQSDPMMAFLSGNTSGLDFDSEKAYR